MNSTPRSENNGYEYMVVGHCKKTGKPFMRPIAWNGKTDAPVYATCSCCQRDRE